MAYTLPLHLDGVERRIDVGIHDLIVWLNTHGYETNDSCSGLREDHRGNVGFAVRSFPYLTIRTKGPRHPKRLRKACAGLSTVYCWAPDVRVLFFGMYVDAELTGELPYPEDSTILTRWNAFFEVARGTCSPVQVS